MYNEDIIRPTDFTGFYISSVDGGVDFFVQTLNDCNFKNIKHMMRYILSRFNMHQRDEVYRIFTTETLKIIAENTAKFAGGKTLKTSYSDLINKNNKSDKKRKEETAEEIIDRICKLVGC